MKSCFYSTNMLSNCKDNGLFQINYWLDRGVWNPVKYWNVLFLGCPGVYWSYLWGWLSVKMLVGLWYPGYLWGWLLEARLAAKDSKPWHQWVDEASGGTAGGQPCSRFPQPGWRSCRRPTGTVRGGGRCSAAAREALFDCKLYGRYVQLRWSLISILQHVH